MDWGRSDEGAIVMDVPPESTTTTNTIPLIASTNSNAHFTTPLSITANAAVAATASIAASQAHNGDLPLPPTSSKRGGKTTATTNGATSKRGGKKAASSTKVNKKAKATSKVVEPKSRKTSETNGLKHKRRYCKEPGCQRIVKSQGLCQRHGAKPRKCKVPSCHKQAQGNFDGMCKSHFKSHKRATTPLPQKPRDWERLHPPPPQGASVYDKVIPESLAWKPGHGDDNDLMPLVAHLKAGFDAVKPPAWHRNEERRARGLWPVHNPATQLEGWERELVWTEILLLTGNAKSSFRHLARGWGRDKGFHMVLGQYIFQRRGDVQRKKRLRQNDLKSDNMDGESSEDEDYVSEDNDEDAEQCIPVPLEQTHQPYASTIMHDSYPNFQQELHGTTSLKLGSAEEAAAIAPQIATGITATDSVEYTLLDDSCYGDAAYNEALAADILSLTGGTGIDDVDPTATTDLIPYYAVCSEDENQYAATAAAAPARSESV